MTIVDFLALHLGSLKKINLLEWIYCLFIPFLSHWNAIQSGKFFNKKNEAIYLAKIYLILLVTGLAGKSDHDGEKTFAIIIGLLAAVAILIIFLAFLRRICEGQGKYHISNFLSLNLNFFYANDYIICLWKKLNNSIFVLIFFWCR